jgi:small-conductance mechanosensitive channel
MAAEGEAARIAARENKLAKLDWNAARPDPPEERPLTSKAEAEMEPAERLEQTERMIGRLKDRIDRIEVRARRAGQTGDQAGSDGTLVKRLRLRVSQLEDTARELRGQEQADVPPTEVPR